MSDCDKKLAISFCGKIIDHLGIQMYQSPMAAIAEIVSNSWDANASMVSVTLPSEQSNHYIINDDGEGMTFDECQDKYLNVGRCRREYEEEQDATRERPILGRKGIGKFAGFGIANVMDIETISKFTGECTKFSLRLDEIRGTAYITKDVPVELTEYMEPSEERKKLHGTTIKLKDIQNVRLPSESVFIKGLSNRFLLMDIVDDFKIMVNSKELDEEYVQNIEFTFPGDYQDSEKYDGLNIDDGWGIEDIKDGQTVKWKIHFVKTPVTGDELRGITIYANGKLAQKAFEFNLTGSFQAQTGLEYIVGRIQADFIDEQKVDLISPERQRINWDYDESLPLLLWGQEKIKELLKIWKKRRAAEKLNKIDDKVSGFGNRLNKLCPSEKRTMKRALEKIASIDSLTQEQFNELGDAVLTSWEKGRLRELIDQIAESDDISEESFLKLIVESHVLSALSIAEGVITKVQAIEGLRKRIKEKVKENPIRDYIASHPWLIGPEYETFIIETKVNNVLKKAAKESKLYEDDNKGRIDLAISSGKQLVILEFMRPDKKIDYDHISRIRNYKTIIEANLKANSHIGFDISSLKAIVVADKLESDAVILQHIETDLKSNISYITWDLLLECAEKEWRKFLIDSISNAPEDARLTDLIKPFIIE